MSTKPYDHYGQRVWIDSAHSRIHAGQMFEAGVFFNERDATQLLDNANRVVILSPSRESHLVLNFAGGGDLEVFRWHNTATPSAGTNMTSFNKDRDSTITSGMTAVYGTTAITTSLGTALPGFFMPGGTGGNASGVQSRGFSHEWDLKGGVNYAYQVYNRSGLTKSISMIFEWYEPGAST